MRFPTKAKTRTLLSEFTSALGSEVLKVRIFRDRGAFVCERELVERDGTSFTMVLPFRDAVAAQSLLTSDPYYPRVRADVAIALGRLQKAMQERDGKPAP